jgi:hypothetical protein
LDGWLGELGRKNLLLLAASPAKPAELGEFGEFGEFGDFGDFGDWKLKIEKKFSLSKPARTTKKNLEFFILFYFLFYFLFLFFFASSRTQPSVRVDAVFTASADGKNPSAGKTASAV